jgi:hypothetical protein
MYLPHFPHNFQAQRLFPYRCNLLLGPAYPHDCAVAWRRYYQHFNSAYHAVELYAAYVVGAARNCGVH